MIAMKKALIFLTAAISLGGTAFSAETVPAFPIDEVKDFVLNVSKKAALLDSWKLKARSVSFAVPVAEYDKVLEKLYAMNPFDPSLTEAELLGLVKGCAPENDFSYELDFSKNMYRLKKISKAAPGAAGDGKNSDGADIVEIESNINSLASSYSSEDNTLQFFKAAKNSHIQILSEYGIDICLMPFDGILQDVPGRKISFRREGDGIEIKTSIHDPFGETQNYLVKNGFVYFLNFQTKMKIGTFDMLLLGYGELDMKNKGVREFYIPKYRVFAQKLDGHDNGALTFHIVESWLPAPITESDMEIQVKPDTKIKNMAF